MSGLLSHCRWVLIFFYNWDLPSFQRLMKHLCFLFCELCSCAWPFRWQLLFLYSRILPLVCVRSTPPACVSALLSHIKQPCQVSWGSHNLWFCNHAPVDSISSHRLRGSVPQNCRSHPPHTPGEPSRARVVACASHSPSLVSFNFQEQLTELRKTFHWLHCRFLLITQEQPDGKNA